jgi:KDO2-lipid IV(A) lauroyltransferase
MMGTRFILYCIQALGHLPLAWLRSLGWVLGAALYALVGSRRKVVRINLELCFPHWTKAQLRHTAFQTFVYFAQAWLDRGWLWSGSADVLKKRLTIHGALHELDGDAPAVLFAPHFMGLDAGWTALTQQMNRQFTTIYTNQSNTISDAWILKGRGRFANARLFGRVDDVKPIVAGLKAGHPLYLLPDMNFGPENSVFVPFFGVMAATVSSLSRFARLGRAKVVPVVTRMTREGYSVDIFPAWLDIPTEDMVVDTAEMNRRLEGFIEAMPAQYYWVHKRFKDRPTGELPPY